MMPHRILVADKDPLSQDTVGRLLSGADNELIGVSSSGELKDAIKNQRPDLIILNSVLADVPGWRIVKRIKESKDYGENRILWYMRTKYCAKDVATRPIISLPAI